MTGPQRNHHGMTNLENIPGIAKTSLELLEAAGFRDAEALAEADAGQLTAELTRANGILKIAKRDPAPASVEKWIRAARKLTGTPEPAAAAAAEPEVDAEPAAEPSAEAGTSTTAAALPVNYEANSEVAMMLAAAPCAIPLPGALLVERRIAVGEIPPGVLLNRYSGDLEIRIEDRLPGGSRPQRPVANQYVRTAEKPSVSRLEIDTERVRNTSEVGNGGRRSGRRTATAKPANAVEDRVTLMRAPREQTNAGKDPNSRRYIRGVLHPHAWSLRFGALVTLLMLLLLPVAIVSSFLLLLNDNTPETYPWVQSWWLVFPLALPVAGIAWLIWGHACTCRICGQKLFVPKKHRKNAKAHHLPLIGYIVPLALHLLVFHWFRCSHCGTPVRLRK